MAIVLVSLLFAAAVSGLTIPSVDEAIPVSTNVTTPASITNETNIAFQPTGITNETNIALQPTGIANETTPDIQNSRVPCRPNSNEPEFLPSLFDCERYELCISGQSFSRSCDNGLIFNIDRNKCSNTGRCLLDYQPICQASGTLLPHVFECRHYFFCEPNQVDPILLACRPGQLFDRNTLRCVPENDAVCGNPPIEDLEPFPGNK